MSASPDPLAEETRRKAVVIGAAGQDGRILCAELEADGYKVARVERAGIRMNDGSFQPYDIRDAAAALKLFTNEPPEEIYYLAAHHHSSEQDPAQLAELLKESFAVHSFGLMHLLDAIASTKSPTRLFYASSSLVFGQPDASPQNEATPLQPACAYSVTKKAGMGICELYRRERNVFCCSGILFNHESFYRGSQFVTKKIVSGAVDIHLGLRTELTLGSLDAQVDWGAAVDYVRAMRLMLSLEEPRDFVIATGEAHSVRDFVEVAFSALGMDYAKHISLRPELVHRAIRKTPLIGDASSLRKATGWFPQVGFNDMIRDMVQKELASRDGTWQTS
jgi:GDPmannose 4,6-dehydratase